MDLWKHRTRGEVSYVRALAALCREQIAQLHGRYCVSAAGI